MLRLSLFLVLICACDTTASTSPPPTAPTVTGAASEEPPIAKKPEGALCGCALCKPLASKDPCKTDDECAPSTPCHAKACIAKAKAEPRRPDQMCTQDLQCDTADANACGCIAGFCSLYPRPTSP